MSDAQTPGRKQPEAFVEEFRSLVSSNVAANVKLVGRISDLVREAARAGAARGQQPLSSNELLSRWLDFNLAAYQALSQHSVAMLDGLVSAAERTLVSSSGTRGAAFPASGKRAEIRLEGRPGDRVSTPFLVENHYDRELRVSFEAAELAGQDGAPPPGARVKFEPTKLLLQPRSQSIVHASVELTKGFVVGKTYATTIKVLGFEAGDIGLTLTVLPKAATAAGGPKSAARARPARTRRVK